MKFFCVLYIFCLIFINFGIAAVCKTLLSSLKTDTVKAVLHLGTHMNFFHILVFQLSKRSVNDMAGRKHGNAKVLFPAVEIPETEYSNKLQKIKPGDYVVVQVSSDVPHCI